MNLIPVKGPVKKSVGELMREKGVTITGGVIAPIVMLILIYGFDVKFDPGHETQIVTAATIIGSTLQTIFIRKGWL